jgi:hypothetical protein
MTQNKFWIVCRYNEQNTPIIEGFFDNLQGAKELSDYLARTQGYNEFYICEPTHHFKADVNVVETVLSEPTIDNTLEFGCVSDEPKSKFKFKIGDRVKYNRFGNTADTYKILEIFDKYSCRIENIMTGQIYGVVGTEHLTHA